MTANQGALTSPVASARQATITVSEFLLNNHQFFRAEIVAINGRSIVRLSRWKKTANSLRPTGQAFEFGAHRTAAVVKILQQVLSALDQGGVR